jgi:hypothetical protein
MGDDTSDIDCFSSQNTSCPSGYKQISAGDPNLGQQEGFCSNKTHTITLTGNGCVTSGKTGQNSKFLTPPCAGEIGWMNKNGGAPLCCVIDPTAN